MILFPFTINRSFLRYPSHPITIPRRYVDYGELEHMLRSSREVYVSPPLGSPVQAVVRHGQSGWGEYYQLQLRTPLDDHGLEQDEMVVVKMFIADGRLEVAILKGPWVLRAA